ncbi:Adhesion G-protein coupled receptor G7 [Acipenser ruthenus]|uniref:Adhesion G-protein coupled receptor G7 n=1 Tax=Acipenser ruthenus TaxID=7906 RepID=A0A662YVG2_ACIRT|nr:Adhesion G-protein coupled receptor G7 [Acipenser ruthenus]
MPNARCPMLGIPYSVPCAFIWINPVHSTSVHSLGTHNTPVHFLSVPVPAYFCESSTDNSTEVLSFNRILFGFSGYSNERCEPQTAWKSRKARSTMPRVSICLCMLIVNILFITGIGNPNGDEVSGRSNSSENTLLSSDLLPLPDKGSCTAVTALLHYFLLGTFAWMSLYAVQMYMSLGLQIFILFTARDSAFQKKMTTIISSISPPELHLHSKTFVIKRKRQDHVSESYKQLEGLSSTTFTFTSTV